MQYPLSTAAPSHVYASMLMHKPGSSNRHVAWLAGVAGVAGALLAVDGGVGGGGVGGGVGGGGVCGGVGGGVGRSVHVYCLVMSVHVPPLSNPGPHLKLPHWLHLYPFSSPLHTPAR